MDEAVPIEPTTSFRRYKGAQHIPLPLKTADTDSAFLSEDRGTTHGRSLVRGGQCDGRDSWNDGTRRQCREDDPVPPSHHSWC